MIHTQEILASESNTGQDIPDSTRPASFLKQALRALVCGKCSTVLEVINTSSRVTMPSAKAFVSAAPTSFSF